jgi:hypothetical protein
VATDALTRPDADEPLRHGVRGLLRRGVLHGRDDADDFKRVTKHSSAPELAPARIGVKNVAGIRLHNFDDERMFGARRASKGVFASPLACASGFNPIC